ncbi:hypothetical protein D9M72_521190 [compost metagenome]
MREHDLARRIPHRVEPVPAVALAGVVHALNQAGGIRAKRWHSAVRGTKSHCFQPQPVQCGMAAGGDEETLSPDAVTVGQGDRKRAVPVPADLLRAGVEADVHAVGPEAGQHQACGVLRVHTE